jgi:trk system potassium uptake protein TrkA
MIKQFAVIGLGRFGSSVAQTLRDMNHEVLVIDNSEDNVNNAMADGLATNAICLDSTNIHALEQIGLSGFDGVVLAIGANMEDSILTALNLMELKAPNLVAKASSLPHGKILERLNVPRVVYPERDMGERVAKSMAQANILEGFELDPRCSIIEIQAPPALVGRSLFELNLRARYGVYVIAIKHGEHDLAIVPSPDSKIFSQDKLVVIGDTQQIRKLIEER